MGNFFAKCNVQNQDLGQFLVGIFMHVSPKAPEISDITGVLKSYIAFLRGDNITYLSNCYMKASD